ncbi:hypothetical protein ENBRE01_0314 [Enteropsectra breve]|nr:hypothetical protein ENBRE01_0314 [Enteropsectra breve]
MKASFLRNAATFAVGVIRAANPDVSDLEANLQLLSTKDNMTSESSSALSSGEINKHERNIVVYRVVSGFALEVNDEFKEIVEHYNSISRGSLKKFHTILDNIHSKDAEECDELVKRFKSPSKKSKADVHNIFEELMAKVSDPNAKETISLLDILTDITVSCFETLNSFFKMRDELLSLSEIFNPTEQAYSLFKVFKARLADLSNKTSSLVTIKPSNGVVYLHDLNPEFFKDEEKYFVTLCSTIPALKKTVDNLLLKTEDVEKQIKPVAEQE